RVRALADRPQRQADRRLAAVDLPRAVRLAARQVAALLVGRARALVLAAGAEAVEARARLGHELRHRPERERPEVVAVDEVGRALAARVALEVLAVHRRARRRARARDVVLHRELLAAGHPTAEA